MGLFGKSTPTVRPTSSRSDVSRVVNAAPQGELDRLSWAQPELDHLSRSLAGDEEVLSLASIQGTGTMPLSLN